MMKPSMINNITMLYIIILWRALSKANKKWKSQFSKQISHVLNFRSKLKLNHFEPQCDLAKQTQFTFSPQYLNFNGQKMTKQTEWANEGEIIKKTIDSLWKRTKNNKP